MDRSNDPLDPAGASITKESFVLVIANELRLVRLNVHVDHVGELCTENFFIVGDVEVLC